MPITTPGTYDLTSGAYHADPALGSTGARELISGCPASFRWKQDHPEQKEEFDVGTATHLLVLEPALFHDEVVIVDAENYRTKVARVEAERARAAGRVPLLPHHLEMVGGMREAVMAHPVARHAFTHAQVERSMFWRDAEFGFMCKTRPDVMPTEGGYLADVKTAASAHPDAFSRSVAHYGYHQQAAWYLDGVAAVTGERRPRFYFIVVEKTPPFLVAVHQLDAEAIEWGRILNRQARGMYAWCVEQGSWPSYTADLTGPVKTFDIGLPHWERRRLQEAFTVGGLWPPQGPPQPQEQKGETDV